MARAARLLALMTALVSLSSPSFADTPISGPPPITFKVTVKVSSLMPNAAKIEVVCAVGHVKDLHDVPTVPFVSPTGLIPPVPSPDLPGTIATGKVVLAVVAGSTGGGYDNVVTVPINTLKTGESLDHLAKANVYRCFMALRTKSNEYLDLIHIVPDPHNPSKMPVEAQLKTGAPFRPLVQGQYPPK